MPLVIEIAIYLVVIGYGIGIIGFFLPERYESTIMVLTFIISFIGAYLGTIGYKILFTSGCAI